MDSNLENILDKEFVARDYSLEKYIDKDEFIQDAKEQLINNIQDKASLYLENDK